MKKSTQIFTIKKIPKAVCQCICLAVILIDSVYRKGKDCFRQMFLEECKYVFKEKKNLNILLTTKNFFPDDSDRENSDEENRYTFF